MNVTQAHKKKVMRSLRENVVTQQNSESDNNIFIMLEFSRWLPDGYLSLVPTIFYCVLSSSYYRELILLEELAT